MIDGFELHPALARDAIAIGHFPLCRLLVMNERRYPWFILVPARVGVSEIFELAEADQQQLMRESSLLAARLAECLRPDKLNIAAIGNKVRQLHVHHVARFADDAAWPETVWGKFEPDPYRSGELSALLGRVDLATLAGFGSTERVT